MLEITPLFLILTAELLTLTTFVLKIILRKEAAMCQELCRKLKKKSQNFLNVPYM